jgi:hypothetical protein
VNGSARVALLLMVLVAIPAGALAQAADASRFEVSGGIRWIGPIAFGDIPANEITFNGGTRPLFESETTLDGSLGGTVTFGVRLTHMLRAETAVVFSPTQLTTRITADAEGVADTGITSPVTQFIVEGGLLAQPRQWRAGRLAPFATGGIGYLRQLNDGRTLVETGRTYYVGGGLYYVRASASPRRVKAVGVRADVRAVFLKEGVAPDSEARTTPAVTATLFVRF